MSCSGATAIGDEREIEAVVLREFAATGAKTWQDGMSNIIAHVPGDGPRVVVAAHKDELGLIISHMAEDGVLRVLPLGGPRPWKYGEGPIDIIADDGQIIPSVLSLGSTHTRSGPVGEFHKGTRTPDWDDVTLVHRAQAGSAVAAWRAHRQPRRGCPRTQAPVASGWWTYRRLRLR